MGRREAVCCRLRVLLAGLCCAAGAWGPEETVTGLHYSDSNPEEHVIEGLVQWAPPTDASSITRYAVFIAYDEQNTDGAQLWDANESNLLNPFVPVGTNALDIYPDTRMRTTYPTEGHPAKWLLVFPWRPDIGLAPASMAAKIPLVDLSTGPVVASAPSFTAGESVKGVTFTDTNPTVHVIEGLVQWTPPDDTSSITRYAAFIAYDEQNTDGAQLFDADEGNPINPFIPVGTNVLNVFPDTEMRTSYPYEGHPAKWLLVFPWRPDIGLAPAAYAAKVSLADLVASVPAPSPPTFAAEESMLGVTFSDTNPAPNVLGGLVQWTPPADTSRITRYAVFIAYDEQNTDGAQLLDADEGNPINPFVPVGTNVLSVYPGTEKRTTSPAGDHPAEWLLVFPWRPDIGLAPAAHAAKIPLADLSASTPAVDAPPR